jgi:hypothetical protein
MQQPVRPSQDNSLFDVSTCSPLFALHRLFTTAFARSSQRAHQLKNQLLDLPRIAVVRFPGKRRSIDGHGRSRGPPSPTNSHSVTEQVEKPSPRQFGIPAMC